MSESNKCVYLHKDKEDIVRYVGSGTLKRAFLRNPNSNRGKLYADFVTSHGKLEVTIVEGGMNKSDAEKLELEMYYMHLKTLLNARRPYSVKFMTKDMFENILYYDESSSTYLRWKVDRGIKIKAGSEAGHINKVDGYYTVTVSGYSYRIHRVIAVLFGLNVNDLTVDHIDRNKSNNGIENLIVVSQLVNNNNKSIQKLSSKSKSGVRGVTWQECRNRWAVQWRDHDRRVSYKFFPVSNYNDRQEAFYDAVKFRKQMYEMYYVNKSIP